MKHANGHGLGGVQTSHPGRHRGLRRHVAVEAGAPCECTLDALRGGDEVEILEVTDKGARMHTLRFGMAEGSRARCITRIPAGPVVMQSGRQEIAVGRKLAQRIRVRKINRDDVKAAG